MAAEGHEIIKAGWLQRKSNVLGRWKPSWFILFKDGVFGYYNGQDAGRCKAEKAVKLQNELLSIQTGFEITEVKPPTGIHPASLLTLNFRNNEKWHLAAESPDDLSAWRMSLEMFPRAPQRPPTAPNMSRGGQNVVHIGGQTTYPQQTLAYGYPGQTVYGSNPPQTMVQNPQPQTTVVVLPSPRRYGYSPWWWY